MAVAASPGTDRLFTHMKNCILTIFAALSLAPCPGQDGSAARGAGIIERIMDEKTYPCLHRYAESPHPKEYVIDSEEVYRRYKSKLATPCDLPDIDFNKHTLLGMHAGGNNYCSVEYRKHVEDDRTSQRFIFIVTVMQEGFCKRAVRWHWHWVIVPRLPASYRVEFKVNRIRNQAKASGNRKNESTQENSLANCSLAGRPVFTPGKSGISGKTVAGPNRPVNTEGDTTDSYVPYRSAGVIRRAADNKVVFRYSADADGEFWVPLPPGKYRINPQPSNNGPWPRPGAPCDVVVQPDHYVDIILRYDTGIR